MNVNLFCLHIGIPQISLVENLMKPVVTPEN